MIPIETEYMYFPSFVTCYIVHFVLDQTDVSGQCSSNYAVQEKGWYSTVVKRSRDLNACSQRSQEVTGLQSSPFNQHAVSTCKNINFVF